MNSISKLNQEIEAGIDMGDSPSQAAKAARQYVQDVATDLSDSDIDQAEMLSRVHYAALKDVLQEMPTDSLREPFNTWSSDDLTEQFGSRQLRQLLRGVRKIQRWGGSLNMDCSAHLLRTGYCGEEAEGKYSDAEDGVYHPFTSAFLRILHSKAEDKAKNYDQRQAHNAWTADGDDDENSDPMPKRTSRATESTSKAQGSETDKAEQEVNGSNDAADQHSDDVGTAILRLVERKIDASVDEGEVREIVQEELERHEEEPDRILVDTSTGDEVSCDDEHRMYPAIYTLAKIGIPVFMSGGPGSGKSTLARHVGRDLGVGSRVISLSPDKREYHFSGYRNANGELQFDTAFREVWENGGVCMFDEVATAHPSVLTVLNDAIANDTFEFADGPIEKHEDFRLLLADNTGGKGGTALFPDRNRMDSAFLDRLAYIEVETDWGLVSSIMGVEDGASSDPPFKFVEQSVEKSEWLTYVKQCAQEVDRQQKPHVIGTRSALQGAKMLQAGFPVEFVKSAVVWRSCDYAIRRKVERSIDATL